MARRVFSSWHLQLALLLPALALQGIAATVPANVDRIVEWGLRTSGAPSASVAIVADGRLAFAKAFGQAGLQPPRSATSEMRYAIGSISKQFTAAAVLFLVEEHKLSLDDPVSKYIPDLTRAGEVTVRMLLSHTSGYSDYWPEDYVMTTMMQPVTPREVMEKWGKRALDFDPGTKWQYSNTNYVIAGQIVEKVSGQPLLKLLKERIFDPLHMTSVYDVDRAPLPASDASGYYRHALGPLRPAPKEGRGWLSAAGELAMTASDLARWDISLINQSCSNPIRIPPCSRRSN